MQTELTSRAQIRALQAQIRPHFLFNTLNVLSKLIHTDPRKAEDLTEELRRGLTVYYVDEIDEVLKLALQATPAARHTDGGRGDDARKLSLA